MTHFSTRSHTRARREPPASAERVARVGVSTEEIARLAYSYWEARGRQDGFHMDDWLRAEKELKEPDSQSYK